MGTAPFWALTQRVVVIADVSGQPIASILKCQDSRRFLTFEDWTTFSQCHSCIFVHLVFLSSSFCIFNLYTNYAHMYVLNWTYLLKQRSTVFLCFVDRASLYNLVNNLVHNCFFLVYLCLSISACFGLLRANHQEIWLCLCDTWYLFFCMYDCLVCRVPVDGPIIRRYSGVYVTRGTCFSVCMTVWYAGFQWMGPSSGDTAVFMWHVVLVFLYVWLSGMQGSTRWAHHQEIQLCLCDTWFLFFCMDDCLVCRVPVRPLHTRQSYIQKNKYHVSHKHSCISWWWAHSSLKHVEIGKYKYTKKKMCTKLVY